MKTYIYTVKHSSSKRGYNRTVFVYRLKNNEPYYIGCDDEISTASYKGDYAIASKIINREDGHKLTPCGYGLLSKNITLIEL